VQRRCGAVSLYWGRNAQRRKRNNVAVAFKRRRRRGGEGGAPCAPASLWAALHHFTGTLKSTGASAAGICWLAGAEDSSCGSRCWRSCWRSFLARVTAAPLAAPHAAAHGRKHSDNLLARLALALLSHRCNAVLCAGGALLPACYRQRRFSCLAFLLPRLLKAERLAADSPLYSITLSVYASCEPAGQRRMGCCYCTLLLCLCHVRTLVLLRSAASPLPPSTMAPPRRNWQAHLAASAPACACCAACARLPSLYELTSLLPARKADVLFLPSYYGRERRFALAGQADVADGRGKARRDGFAAHALYAYTAATCGDPAALFSAFSPALRGMRAAQPPSSARWRGLPALRVCWDDDGSATIAYRCWRSPAALYLLPNGMVAFG